MTKIRVPNHTIAAMAGVMSAMFLAALDQTIVATAMPRIIADLHGFAHYSGVVTSYMVASTIAVPIAGKLSDFYGRKLFLLIGVCEFIFSSSLCGFAQDMTQLIIFRGLQGLGAGMTQAMAFTTISDLFPPSKRGKVAGLVGASFGMASVVGPAIGGFLTDGPGWRYVFLVNIPLGLIALAILVFYFPNIHYSRDGKPKVDYFGALWLIVAVIPLLLALSWGGRDYSWFSSETLALVLLSMVGFFALLKVEMVVPEPIIPLSIFRNSVVSVSIIGATLVGIALFGATLFIPLYTQSVIGLSATQSGAVMMPMTLALVAASFTGGQIMGRTGRYRWLARCGLVIATTGMFLLSQLDNHSTYGDVMRNIIILGFGLGMTMPVFSLAVQNAVSVQMLGVSTAVVQFMRTIGGAIGAAVFAALLVNRFEGYFRSILDPSLLAKMPEELLNFLQDPQAIMREGFNSTLNKFLLTIPGDKEMMAKTIVVAVKGGLGEALHEVFLVATFLLLLGTIATFFLQDIALRSSNKVEAKPKHLDVA